VRAREGKVFKESMKYKLSGNDDVEFYKLKPKEKYVIIDPYKVDEKVDD
jgi:hypothetical protein